MTRFSFLTVIWIAFIVGLLVLIPQDASAAPLKNFNFDGPRIKQLITLEGCRNESGLDEDKLTQQVVYCVKQAMLHAVFEITTGMRNYMKDVLTVCFTLYIALFAIRVMGGEPQLVPSTAKTLIRIAVVWLLFNNIPAMAYYAYGITDWFIKLVLIDPTFTPWEKIDSFLSRLMGFAPGLTLVNGVAGIIFALAVSGTLGTSVFTFALIGMYTMMMFILEIVYTYLAAFMSIGFLMILAPLVIPLALFSYTDQRFFSKWFKNLITAMITPMMLLGFLQVSLGYFDELIDDAMVVFSDNKMPINEDGFAMPDMSEFWRANQNLIPSWVLVGDPTTAEKMRDEINKKVKAGEMKHKIMPPVATEINPHARVGMEKGGMMSFVTTYPPQKLQDLLLAIIPIFIYALMLLGLVRKMPELATAIAGGVTISMASSATFMQEAQQKMNDAGTGIGALIGAAGGGGIGSAVAGNRAASFGRWTGAAIGGSIGGQMGSKLTTQLSSLVGRR